MGYHPTWNEYNAAYHLLTTPLIAERMERHIHEDGFNWEVIIEEVLPVLSSGERILVCAAYDLWSGKEWDDDYKKVDLREVVIRLDDQHTQRVIEAMEILGGSYRCLFEDVMGGDEARR